ncbi:hypothetical protein ACWKXX_07720 [Enterobacter sp. UPMP2061]
MAYGTQVLVGSTDMVSIVDPAVYLDVLSTPTNGSKNYTVPSGYTLQYIVGVNNGNSQPTVTVSGSTISWNGISSSAMLWVFVGR